MVYTCNVNDDNFNSFGFYSKPSIVLGTVYITSHRLLTILYNKAFLSIFK